MEKIIISNMWCGPLTGFYTTIIVEISHFSTIDTTYSTNFCHGNVEPSSLDSALMGSQNSSNKFHKS